MSLCKFQWLFEWIRVHLIYLSLKETDLKVQTHALYLSELDQRAPLSAKVYQSLIRKFHPGVQAKYD